MARPLFCARQHLFYSISPYSIGPAFLHDQILGSFHCLSDARTVRTLRDKRHGTPLAFLYLSSPPPPSPRVSFPPPWLAPFCARFKRPLCLCHTCLPSPQTPTVPEVPGLVPVQARWSPVKPIAAC